MCLRTMVGSERKNQSCVDIYGAVVLVWDLSDCSECGWVFKCVCCVDVQCSLCALHKPAADLGVLEKKHKCFIFWGHISFLPSALDFFMAWSSFFSSLWFSFVSLIWFSSLWFSFFCFNTKCLCQGGLITVNLWRCGKMWWAPLCSVHSPRTDFTCPSQIVMKIQKSRQLV